LVIWIYLFSKSDPKKFHEKSFVYVEIIFSRLKVWRNFVAERNPGLEDSIWKRSLFNMKQKHKCVNGGIKWLPALPTM
jgi:hypothetical protein